MSEILLFIMLIVFIAAAILLVFNRKELLSVIKDKDNKINLMEVQLGSYNATQLQLMEEISQLRGLCSRANQDLEEAVKKNKDVVSQRISQSVRTGQIVEQLAPFLNEFPYDPKSCHFLGQPIDFIVFDFDEGKIVFLEIKSGNAKESPRQKKIKNIIKTGRVYYEKLRVSPKGVILKTEENLD